MLIFITFVKFAYLFNIIYAVNLQTHITEYYGIRSISDFFGEMVSLETYFVIMSHEELCYLKDSLESRSCWRN